MIRLILPLLFIASVCFAGEPKITVGDCKPIKRPEMARIIHHPLPGPRPIWIAPWPRFWWYHNLRPCR